MNTKTAQEQPRRPQPLPVRLADMAAIEQRYLAASPDDRMAYHLGLGYYELLSDEERFALERRFPNELTGEPGSVDSTEGTRVAWDLRSRELIVCMLQFGERVLEARMDLVRQVAPAEDVAALAMTATGSFLELGRPLPDGSRSYTYRASARPGGGRRSDGMVRLEEPLLLGNAVWLDTRFRTSELLIIATGPTLPSGDDVTPGRPKLFGPVEDEDKPQPDDPMRVGFTRFRVLVDAAQNAAEVARAELHERAAQVAQELQRRLADAGGYLLDELAAFTTSNGTRYEVRQHGAMDVVRRGADDEALVWMSDADIGAQTVVAGAPLVIFYRGVHAARKVAFVFRVAAVEPLEGGAPGATV
jgi:hypothetical protein